MKKILKELLSDVIKLDSDEIDSDDYAHAIHCLFCGIGKASDYERLLKKWFIEPIRLDNLTIDVENTCILNISETELRVIIFNDGYDGYLLSFGVKDGKLEIKETIRVEDDENGNSHELFDENELDEDEINNLMK